MAKKKDPPSEDFTKLSNADLADKLGYLSAALAQPLTDFEAMKDELKSRAISKITVTDADTSETVKEKLEAAGRAGIFRGELFEVNVFAQNNTQTDKNAMVTKLEALMTAPGQFTRFMNSITTTGLKWIVKPSVLKKALPLPKVNAA